MEQAARRPEPLRIYSKPKTQEERGPSAQDERSNTDISTYDVLSNVGKWLTLLASNIRDYFRNPCNDVWMIIVIPFAMFIMFSLCLFLPFPLGVLLLLKVLKTKPVTEGPSTDLARGLTAAKAVFALRKFRYRLTSYIAKVSEEWLKKIFSHKARFSLRAYFVGWFFLLPTLFFSLLVTTILLLPFFTLVLLVSFIFTAVFGIITSKTVTPGAPHVPSFYAPETKSDKHSRMVVFALFGAIFGGLHCFGWNFTYPTPFEQHLWRATSLAITVIPIVVAPIDWILENKFENASGTLVKYILDLIMTILLVGYVLARLSLIAQALALLRNQPPSAFLAVDWTKYIPHIF